LADQDYQRIRVTDQQDLVLDPCAERLKETARSTFQAGRRWSRFRSASRPGQACDAYDRGLDVSHGCLSLLREVVPADHGEIRVERDLPG
jgi:hypothetical protein